MLGLIAGGGDLPRAVAQAAQASGRAVFVVALTGSAVGDWIQNFAHAVFSPGEPGRIIAALRKAGVTHVLMCGQVDRPKFQDLKLDAKGMLLLPKAIAAARQGDDALLRFIVGICEDAGFSAISVADAAPSLVCDEGTLGRHQPSAEDRSDIAKAFAIVRALGSLDVGQGAVVCDGLALAVEAAEGTDAMLMRVPALREALRGTPAKPRGVLVKALKPTQDAKTDMPVIGIDTIKNAHAAHLSGIALEAGQSLILDKAGIVALADRLGLFVIGVTP